MPVQVIVFGQLTDILGHQPITMDDAPGKVLEVYNSGNS